MLPPITPDGPAATGGEVPHSTIPTRMLYCGQASTFVCEPGDVTPHPPKALRPLTPTGLETFVERLVRREGPPRPTAAERTSRPSSAAAVSPPLLLSAAQELQPLLGGRHVIAVIPLANVSTGPSSAATAASRAAGAAAGSSEAGQSSSSSSGLLYMEDLVQFLFHPLVGVASLVVLSDAVATTLAVGRSAGVMVLQASPLHCSVVYVVEGCSTRYSSCRWDRLWSSGDTKQPAGAVQKWTPRLDWSDLENPKCRQLLVEYFGSAAVESVTHSETNEEVSPSASGSPRSRVMGKVEQLLWRVYRPNLPKEVLLSGEAMEAPIVAALLQAMLCQPPLDTGAAAVGTKRIAAEESEESERGTSWRWKDKSLKTESTHNTSHSRSARQKRRILEEEEEEESADVSSEEETTSSDSSEDSDSSDSSSEVSASERSTSQPSDTLCVLPSCPPNAPWWMPLVGASVMGELPERDVRTFRLTRSEVQESAGGIVRWKALL